MGTDEQSSWKGYIGIKSDQPECGLWEIRIEYNRKCERLSVSTLQFLSHDKFRDLTDSENKFLDKKERKAKILAEREQTEKATKLQAKRERKAQLLAKRLAKRNIVDAIKEHAALPVPVRNPKRYSVPSAILGAYVTVNGRLCRAIRKPAISHPSEAGCREAIREATKKQNTRSRNSI